MPLSCPWGLQPQMPSMGREQHLKPPSHLITTHSKKILDSKRWRNKATKSDSQNFYFYFFLGVIENKLPIIEVIKESYIPTPPSLIFLPTMTALKHLYLWNGGNILLVLKVGCLRL